MLLADLRQQIAALQPQELTGDDRKDALVALDTVTEQAQREQPPAQRIVEGLNTVNRIIEAAKGPAKAAALLAPLVAQAIRMAQALFR